MQLALKHLIIAKIEIYKLTFLNILFVFLYNKDLLLYLTCFT